MCASKEDLHHKRIKSEYVTIDLVLYDIGCVSIVG